MTQLRPPLRGFLFILVATVLPQVVMADRDRNWSLFASGGVSVLPDLSTTVDDTADIDGDYRVDTDTGFSAGLGLRHRYGNGWESEFAWEYRSNDAELVPATGDSLSGGNYASNTFYLNARRYVGHAFGAETYLGAGLFVTQELDIDFELVGGERSFEQGGAWGGQLLAGVVKPMGNRLLLGVEARFATLAEETLEEEAGLGTLGPIDYDPISVQLHVGWRF